MPDIPVRQVKDGLGRQNLPAFELNSPFVRAEGPTACVIEGIFQ